MTSVVCVCPVGDVCGEGLVWSEPQGALFWTDINRFLVHRHVPGSNSTETWQFEKPAVAIGLTVDPDTLLIALASRLVLWSPTSGEQREHGFTLRDAPRLRLNDGGVGPRGEFVVGSMKNNVEVDGALGTPAAGQGSLYSIYGSERVELENEIGIPNTICWSPDQDIFYFADTLKNEIRAYDYDRKTGAIANARPFFKGFERGLPDGSAIDAEGYLWNCRYGRSCIVRVAPDGNVDRVVEMPIDNPRHAPSAARRDKLYSSPRQHRPMDFKGSPAAYSACSPRPGDWANSVWRHEELRNARNGSGLFEEEGNETNATRYPVHDRGSFDELCCHGGDNGTHDRDRKQRRHGPYAKAVERVRG